ncbi:MAG TPA: DNA-processing protein DprA [Candidatus Acidoferrum sp.]|nr:DNA-processing protein DprA [Candidatus Acidoferrum sp.]
MQDGSRRGRREDKNFHPGIPEGSDGPELGTAEREARWAFGLLPQLGGVGLQGLLSTFGTATRAWEASVEMLRAVPGIGPAAAQAVSGYPWARKLREEQARVTRAGLRVIVWGDAEYPPLLRHIASAPVVLYQRGSLEPGDEAAVAIVGARHATGYGETVAHELGMELSRRGLTIVSGLARGIDAAAHRGALEATGRTLAVLGSGLDQIYPPEHVPLADQVAASGALLSEFPLGTAPLRPHFPRRNRIISGLSLGVIVVEAGVDSGALITAHHALEQGREVFAVPGRVHARYSEGCNRLIKAGAKLVETWEDVLGELVPHLKGRKSRRAETPPPPDLRPEEQRVFELLADGPLHIDLLIGRAGLQPGRVASALVGLEMKGVVRQLHGKVFERTDSG